MKLVNDDNSLNCTEFKCLETGMYYEVTGSKDNGKAIDTIDTLIREDGKKKKVLRSSLKKRYTNIEYEEVKYSKSKRRN